LVKKGNGFSLHGKEMKGMKIRKIGIVGSGHIGGTLGILFAKAGYGVVYSSRHPDTLKDLVKTAGPNACAGAVAEAIAFGEVIVLSLPFKAIPELDAGIKKALQGKIVIDTSNPYPERDGILAEDARNDAGGMGVVVARLLPGARIVRAFNTVYSEDLLTTRNNAGEKIGIPIAGDDLEGLSITVELVKDAGLDPVVVGNLSSSKLFDVGTAVYATSAPAREIRLKLNLETAALKRAA
jgi:predicted dinucleotide-binding enzyme